MNNYAPDIITLFFVLLCCFCTFLIVLLAFVFFILGSARVRSALLAISLIKTVIDVVKDITGAAKTVKSASRKLKKTPNVTEAKLPSNVLDAEFREKKSKN